MGKTFTASQEKTDKLSLDNARKIAEVTSGIFQQGGAWVFRQWDLDSGVEKLTRGLSEKSARTKLKNWRRERVETLLRGNGTEKAYTLKKWHQNPTWDGEGIWEWAQKNWFTTQKDAEEAMKKHQECDHGSYKIFEMNTKDLPGHFTVN